MGFRLYVAFVILGLLGLAACGSLNSPAARTDSGFELRVLPESFEHGGQAALSLARQDQPDGAVVLELRADDAQSLRAAFVEVAYDAGRYAPVEAELSSALAAGAAEPVDGVQVLELARLDGAGAVQLGQVLVRPQEQPGFSGSAVLATLRFAPVGSAAAPERTASRAPTSNASASVLSHDMSGDTLHWGYYCAGDYDQNGEVNIADLSPLAKYFGLRGNFNPDSIHAVVDGDSNKEINVADITPIGVNFGAKVGAYSVFASAAAGDYPAGNGAAAVLPALASVDYAQFSGSRTTGRIYFSLPLAAHAAQYYWVRPADGTELGTSSNMLSVTASNAAPVITALTADATSITSGAATTVSVEAGDPDGDALSFSYTATAGTVVGTGSSVVFNAPVTAVDTTARITAYVSDGRGGSASQFIDVSVTGETPPLPDKWNIMVWIAGDNNLAAEAAADLNEMELFGGTETVRVFAGFDIDPVWAGAVDGIDNVNFIRVVPDSDPGRINVLGDPANRSFPRTGYDSSSPAHVREFVDWVNANFPAQHTALVLWNHGDGWLPGNKVFSAVSAGTRALKRERMLRGHNQLLRVQGGFRRPSGVLGDDADGAWELSNNGMLVDALAGLHFDVLHFDACNMGQLEALYEYRALADVLVGSQCLVPGAGLPYTKVLDAFAAAPQQDAARLGEALVHEYVDHYAATGEFVIMSSFDSAGIGALTEALAAFAGEVQGKAAAESAHVKEAIAGSFEPLASDGTRDLAAFLSAYEGLTADAGVRARIDAVQAALEPARLQFAQFDQAGSQGLGVWLPSDFYFDPFYTDQYETIPFNQATGWLAMLQATGVPGGTSGGVYDIEADWAAGDYLELDWGNTLADVDLATTDPDGTFWSPYDGPQTDNLRFSPDSADSGEPREWAQLRTGAAAGEYYIDLAWFSYDGAAPPQLNVSVKLYDSGMQLKQDLGTCTLGFIGDYFGYGILRLTP